MCEMPDMTNWIHMCGKKHREVDTIIESTLELLFYFKKSNFMNSDSF